MTVVESTRPGYHVSSNMDDSYDPQTRTIHLKYDYKTADRTTIFQNISTSDEYSWIWEHEYWHSACNNTTVQQTIFLLNNILIQYIKSSADNIKELFQNSVYTDISSEIRELDTLIQSLIDKSRLSMECYSLLKNPVLDRVNGLPEYYNVLETDLEEVAAILGREKAESLVEKVAWYALNPDLGDYADSKSFIEYLIENKSDNEIYPDPRFSKAISYIRFNSGSIRKDISPEELFQRLEFSVADHNSHTDLGFINDLIMGSLPDIPKKFKNIEHATDLLDISDCNRQLRKSNSYLGILNTFHLFKLLSISNDVTGPLHIHIQSENKPDLLLLNPEIPKVNSSIPLLIEYISTHIAWQRHKTEIKNRKPFWDSKIKYLPQDLEPLFNPSRDHLQEAVEQWSEL